MVRAWMSGPLPAAKPTSTRTGLEGYCCACAVADDSARARNTKTRNIQAPPVTSRVGVVLLRQAKHIILSPAEDNGLCSGMRIKMTVRITIAALIALAALRADPTHAQDWPSK